MAQQVISQRIRRTCEGCGISKEYELIADVQDETLRDLEQWHNITKNVFVIDKFVPLTAQACSAECVPSATIRLAEACVKFREEAEQQDHIDLQTLKLNSTIQ